jgi:hypothetical protein
MVGSWNLVVMLEQADASTPGWLAESGFLLRYSFRGIFWVLVLVTR